MSKTEEQLKSNVETPAPWVRVIIILLLTVTLLIVPISLLSILYFGNVENLLVKIVNEHVRAFLGVPWAGGAAFVVVLVLRSSYGQIEFKILGVEFTGASGPIAFWVFCFLAEVLAVSVLW